MATKKEVKLVKKSEHTETKTQKAGSATLSVKVKSTEQEVEVKEEVSIKSDRRDKIKGEKKANLAFLNSNKDLQEALYEYYESTDIYGRLEEKLKLDEDGIEDFLYDSKGNYKNIEWIYYTLDKEDNYWYVVKVKFKSDDEKDSEIIKYLNSDFSSDNREAEFAAQREIENTQLNKSRDESPSDLINKLLEAYDKETEEKFYKIKTKTEKVTAKSGRSKWRKTSESIEDWKKYANAKQAFVDKYLNPAFNKNVEGSYGEDTWEYRVIQRFLKGIDYKPYAWSPSTGFSHHLPSSEEKERKYNKAYYETKKKERAENRKAANENLASVKSQYQTMQRIVQNQAYKRIQEIKRAKGYKFDVSALPLPPMPNIKLPQVQVTEWAGKEIFTPLLDPLAQKSKVVIEVRGDETGKKNFIRRPPDLSGLRNVKKEDYKISRNYFKAGCTLEFYPCLVAATYFQILVALTPIDEEYTYTKSEFHSNEKELIRNIRQMGRKINKKNMIQKYNELKQTYGNERNNYKGLTTQLQTWETKREIHHKIDNDIVRADWVLKFRGKEFKAFKSSRSGSYIEFEEDWFASYADQDSIYKIAGVIYDNVKDLDDFSQGFDCINLNPRKDMLEYGGYNAPTTEEHGLLTRRIGTRYHFEHGVTNKGYVYQAPAGFERITEDYYIKCLQANRGFATKFINTCTTDKYKGLQTKKQFMDENSKMFRRLKKLDPTLGAEFKPKGD